MRVGQRIVAPFAGDGVRAGDDAAVDHDAATDSGAEDDREHHLAAGTGTIGRLRQPEAVGIVGERDRAVELVAQVAVQGPAVEPGRVGVLDHAGRGRDRPRMPDADGAALAELGLDVPYQPGNRIERRVVVGRRRRPAAAHQLTSLLVERDHLDLGAAQVDPDRQRHSRSSALPFLGPL
jgi:hypothetical protein